jgi:ParB family chromosome partitioning protein
MTAQSTHPAPKPATDAGAILGATLVVPLNRLKASPKNARKTPHAAATIEALAASIKAKGVLQPPVVEIERRADGAPTGDYLVTIGEGRRQALRLLAKRKTIKRTHPVRVTVDETNDAHEISLDENITREAMHPADQFEAFKRVADEKGWGAEEIAARFGVSAQTVRQRMRLGAVAPELIAAYRAGKVSLDQLMAFGVSDDHARQRQVYEQTGPYAAPYVIRRAMTEAKVRADDRRARFVGVEAYAAAGGGVLRDLFTEDRGGWFEDVALLDQLAEAKLAALADEVREREAWKWAEGRIDMTYDARFGRVWPEAVIRTEDEAAAVAALAEEYDRLIAEADEDEGLSESADARLDALDRDLQAYGPDYDYPAEAKARAGVMVILGHDGTARFERGLVRAEDMLASPETEGGDGGSGDDAASEDRGADAGDAPSGLAPEPPSTDSGAPLSDRLIIDLSAHKTMGLRDALQTQPILALTALVHALALSVFYPTYDPPTPLQLRLTKTGLERAAPGVSETPAGRLVAERGEAWAARLPDKAADLWAALVEMPGPDLLDLLAYCAGLGVQAVRDPHDRHQAAWAQAEVLATACGLDMRQTWTATAASYFGRVSKARVLDAVSEAVDAEQAGRLAGMKKADMAEAAEGLVAGTGWLPPLLRTAPANPQGEAKAPDDPDQAEGEVGPPTGDPDAYPFAAE